MDGRNEKLRVGRRGFLWLMRDDDDDMGLEKWRDFSWQNGVLEATK